MKNKTGAKLIDYLPKNLQRLYRPWELFFEPHDEITHYVRMNGGPGLHSFNALCLYHDQKRLKEALYNEITKHSHLYATEAVCDEECGFAYFPADNCNIMLVAHVDTVHEDPVENIYEIKDKGRTCIWSPEGIGGDDRCGIWIILRILRETGIRPAIAFCEDEEIGALGARKLGRWLLENNLAQDIRYVLEFDRAGDNDAVFYQCNNSEFKEYITDTTGFTEELGTYSDISCICPCIGRAGVNLSCGYYNEHTTFHYVVKEEMDAAFEIAKKLLEDTSDEVYHYQDTDNDDDDWDDIFDRLSKVDIYSDPEYDLYLDVEADYDI